MADIQDQVKQATEIVRLAKFDPSISYLQRQMRIGFNAASNIMDILVEERVLARDAQQPWKFRVI